jgi:hypothetical protein
VSRPIGGSFLHQSDPSYRWADEGAADLYFNIARDIVTEADKLIKDATPAYFLRLLERGDRVDLGDDVLATLAVLVDARSCVRTSSLIRACSVPRSREAVAHVDQRSNEFNHTTSLSLMPSVSTTL